MRYHTYDLNIPILILIQWSCVKWIAGLANLAIFIGDFSRFTWLYPLKWTSNVLDCFIKFQRLVEKQFDQKIKIFQCSGGGEFNSNDFINHTRSCGIELYISYLGTSQQNRVAEWKHWHIVEKEINYIFFSC